MMDSSVFLENSGGGADGGSGSDGVGVDLRNDGGSGGGEESDRNSAGNRWPREETLALLKIRSEMDLAFRDSTLKAPLWDEVSRKLSELGYNRSAKKCKEKFENIYKYHKRTKDGRSSRQNGKNYRFFEQLELFDSQFSVPSTPTNQIPSYAPIATSNPATTVVTKPISCSQDFTIPSSNQDRSGEFMSASTSTASSSKESEGSIKKKRKLEDYFERLMKDVLEKQEDLQNKLLEAIEKCEKDRIAREEEWKMQEMARIKREQELLAKEREITAAKDAALLAFLQKMTQQTTPLQIPEILTPLFEKLSDKRENVLEKHAYVQENGVGETSTHIEKQDNSGGENTIQTSSSRWPKAEIEALIMLKTDLDLKYQDSGPKGPLWEEISSGMKKLGYDRSAKRCKEKWENINKYYKRVKESNKKRPEDSKTCPYFNMLESLYAKRSKKSENVGRNLKPEQILMQMMGQHQQQQQQQKQQQQQSTGEYGEKDQQSQEDDVENEHNDDSGDGYQVVANNLSSVKTLG
ncbi:Transcription factor GT-2 [Handroanthus impetiginosus]|uniref:Transcription factor GT-2 n=1 Tax=Handroanthus impetiginosus TaxID=429701 RepID=A0A2G9H252_9LAMI|nr:Transcription factor GT-2 [Handroanthus impetiginosus]